MFTTQTEKATRQILFRYRKIYFWYMVKYILPWTNIFWESNHGKLHKCLQRRLRKLPVEYFAFGPPLKLMLWQVHPRLLVNWISIASIPASLVSAPLQIWKYIIKPLFSHWRLRSPQIPVSKHQKGFWPKLLVLGLTILLSSPPPCVEHSSY